MDTRNQEKKETPATANTHLKLPNALPDYRFIEHAWQGLKSFLELNKKLGEKIASSYLGGQFFCPVTKCLMYEPVRVIYLNKEILLERETLDFLAVEIRKIKNMPAYAKASTVVIRDFLCTQYPFFRKIEGLVALMIENEMKNLISHLKVRVLADLKMRDQIRKLIERNPSLKEIQYIPVTLIHEMHQACYQGDLYRISRLINQNHRILFIPDLKTQLLPLSYAVINEVSFKFLIESLDRLKPGLALAALVHPDDRGQLPLEHALRTGESVELIIKIMSWMGRTLDTFTLTGPLPKDRQLLLNSLLVVSVLQGNLIWAEKLISWGADIHAPISRDTAVLETALQMADPKIKKALFNTANVNHAENSLVGRSVRTLLEQPISVKIVQEPQVAMGLSPIRQLSEFKSIKVILNVLDNHGISLFSTLNVAYSPKSDQKKIMAPQKSQPASTETNQEQKTQSVSYFQLLETLPCRVVDFLEAVADENVELAEALLMQNPKLATDSGEFLDSSLKITGIQYIFCMQNKELQTMVLKHVSDQEYLSQISALDKTTMKAAADHAMSRKAKLCGEHQQAFKESQNVEPLKQPEQHVVANEQEQEHKQQLQQPPQSKARPITHGREINKLLPTNDHQRVKKPSKYPYRVRENCKLSKARSAFFMPKNINEVTLFWDAVSFRSLAQIDKMLQRNKSLAFVLGAMVNSLNPFVGGFANLTIYQYALLTQDEAMQNIVLKHLTQEQAVFQISRLNENIPCPQAQLVMRRV